MSLTLETYEKQKPIILIYGNNLLIPHLINEYSNNFKIAYVGSVVKEKTHQDFYRIAKNNAQFIKNLEEKIDYAIIFLSEKGDKALVSSFLEKIENDNTQAAVVIDIKNIEDFYDVLLEYKKISSLKFLFLGDVYSEGEPLIQKAIAVHSITISEELEPIFTIYYKDAVSGINQVLFGPKKKERFFNLFYSEPQTVNSIAYILRRSEPDIEINYATDKKARLKSHSDLVREIKSKILVEPIFLDEYFLGFEKSLANFSKNSFYEIPHEKKEKKKHKKPVLKTFILPFIFASFLFIVLNAALIGLGIFQLRASVSAFQKGEYEKAASNIKTASSFFYLSEPALIVVARIANWDFDKIRESAVLMNIAADNFSSISSVTKGLDREALERTISDSIYFYFRFQELKGRLNNDALNTLETFNLSKIASLAQILPSILGYTEEKNYLVLFQNNGELRPTGGFIGSIGELKLKGGRAEITIQDVYEYDGRLKAHVEPHYIIRRFLQPHLYLRDSNFNPDFQKSASMSALLYNLASDKTVDGVIAVNFEAVRRLIEEIGPIELRSYNKTLDAKNTFDFLQSTIDDNFFPGSTQKRDVLTALFNQLMLKLEEDRAVIGAGRLLPKLMEEKNIIFAFNSKSIQSIFNSLGYGGTLSDKRSQAPGRLNDFLAVNEANIGVNNANINVSRETEYSIKISDKIESRVSHTLENSGDREYRAYIRLFVPLASKLNSIYFDRQKQTIVPAITDFKIYERPRFRAPSGLEVDQSQEDNLQVFGFIVTVPPKTSKKIEVVYDSGLALPGSSIISYSLYSVKQPGKGKYPFRLRLEYGDNFIPKEVDNAKLLENSIIIERKILTDEVFDVKLTRSPR
jgi:hypothetical protein